MALPSNPMISTLPPGLRVCLNRDLPLWPAFPSLALLPKRLCPLATEQLWGGHCDTLGLEGWPFLLPRAPATRTRWDRGAGCWVDGPAPRKGGPQAVVLHLDLSTPCITDAPPPDPRPLCLAPSLFRACSLPVSPPASPCPPRPTPPTFLQLQDSLLAAASFSCVSFGSTAQRSISRCK